MDPGRDGRSSDVSDAPTEGLIEVEGHVSDADDLERSRSRARSRTDHERSRWPVETAASPGNDRMSSTCGEISCETPCPLRLSSGASLAFVVSDGSTSGQRNSGRLNLSFASILGFFLTAVIASVFRFVFGACSLVCRTTESRLRVNLPRGGTASTESKGGDPEASGERKPGTLAPTGRTEPFPGSGPELHDEIVTTKELRQRNSATAKDEEDRTGRREVLEVVKSKCRSVEDLRSPGFETRSSEDDSPRKTRSLSNRDVLGDRRPSPGEHQKGTFLDSKKKKNEEEVFDGKERSRSCNEIEFEAIRVLGIEITSSVRETDRSDCSGLSDGRMRRWGRKRRMRSSTKPPIGGSKNFSKDTFCSRRYRELNELRLVEREQQRQLQQRQQQSGRQRAQRWARNSTGRFGMWAALNEMLASALTFKVPSFDASERKTSRDLVISGGGRRGRGGGGVGGARTKSYLERETSKRCRQGSRSASTTSSDEPRIPGGSASTFLSRQFLAVNELRDLLRRLQGVRGTRTARRLLSSAEFGARGERRARKGLEGPSEAWSGDREAETRPDRVGTRIAWAVPAAAAATTWKAEDSWSVTEALQRREDLSRKVPFSPSLQCFDLQGLSLLSRQLQEGRTVDVTSVNSKVRAKLNIGKNSR